MIVHKESQNWYGAASGYLKLAKDKLNKGEKVFTNIFVKDSMFDQPKKGPVIMVGPGTGVVPFIGFLESWELKSHIAPTHLYFGCRKEGSDYIFKEFLTSAKEKGLLTQLRTAFSREEKSQYVQDLLTEDKE